MADKKNAYLINSVRLGGKQHPASTKEKPSILEIDSDSFDRLEKLGAVRVPTKEETAIFQAQQEDADGTTVVKQKAATTEKKEGDETKTASSGASKDPSSPPKGKADKDDLGV